ncbi:MAG: tRNA (adenosine(37)-N6)-threonylcarbamoyltransferase complex dimerization subunit type 1 TsaB [Neisseria sp.]|nr:tRNA (adenosine(37)-N6)-threonylcarbamoyltransferase complex dimerization subunit type 1 TsaB [Neisseria sp.]
MPEIDFSRPVLAIDSGTAVLSLALRAGGEYCVFQEDCGNRQSERLLPVLHELLAQAHIRVRDVAAIVYNQGPGMFTGLRIGIGVAQGLAAPFGTPLIGVPSLDAVAAQLAPHECVLAAIDARMGEVFYAWFDTVNHQRLSDYAVDKAENIRLPENMSVTPQGCGNAFVQPIVGIAGSLNMPDAKAFLELAAGGRYAAKSAANASLLYVRDKIALTAAEQAAAKAAR